MASPITFLTVTLTRERNPHTDVSLWYPLDADADTITSYDEGEIDAIRWLIEEQVLPEPEETLDPHLHRFVRKLRHARATGHPKPRE
ncbi:hypothetical protein H4K36_01950 [Streptomyces sp. DHE7-1]|nr:hypothetical protein [Streptomyces sp. DHE7-1]